MGKRSRSSDTVNKAPGRRPGQSNRIRLIGGEFGGRKLSFPDGRGLRPTSDRVRETLFNWLQPVVVGARCLDLFAGSGALGFEAASRGAGEVLLVDSNPQVCRQLQANIELLGATERVSVQCRDTLKMLAGDASGFDILFLDPPFADAILGQCAEMLHTNGWLHPRAYIYLEQALTDRAPPVPENWQLLKQKEAGQVRYLLYRSE